MLNQSLDQRSRGILHGERRSYAVDLGLAIMCEMGKIDLKYRE